MLTEGGAIMTSDTVIGIVSVLVSLYTIVLSIIGTSRAPISEEALRKKLDKKILLSLFISIIVAIGTIIVSAFIPNSDLGKLINRFLVAVNSGFFIFMVTILFLLCKKNMDAMAKEIDDENKSNVQSKNEIKEIKILLIQINEKLKN